MGDAIPSSKKPDTQKIIYKIYKRGGGNSKNWSFYTLQ